MATFLEHLKAHLRVVSTFFIREMVTRFGTKPGGYIWAFLEPIAYIGMMTVIFSLFARLPAIGDSYPLFFSTGYLAFNLYKGMERYVSLAVRANKNLLAYPVVSPIDAVIARFALEAITSVIICIVIFAAIIYEQPRPTTIHWPPMLEATLLAWIMGMGVGMFNIVMFAKYPLYEQIFSIISRPLLMISGAFYVPSLLPSPASEIMLANPICQIVVLFREGFYNFAGSDGLDLPYLAETSLVLLFIGTLTFTLASGARDD